MQSLNARPSHDRSNTATVRLAVLLMVAATLTVAVMAPTEAFVHGTTDERLERAESSLEAMAAEMDRRIPHLMERLHVPGAALAIVQGGEVVWTGTYGVADIDTQQPVTAETVFQAGSISKSLTAWGVMLLADRGFIDLDAPVEQYLTRWEFPLSPYSEKEVTVERLLSHTAGLPFRIGEAMPLDHLPSPEARLEGANDEEPVRLEEEPGTGFRYSNPGYSVLELLVEEVSGQAFAEFMENKVLEPLGMESSSFRLRDDFEPLLTTGYTFDGEPVPPDRQGPAAASGLYTTAPDMARFIAAATGSGLQRPTGRRLLSEEAVMRMHQPVAPTRGFPHMLLSDGSGLGHFVERVSTGQRAVSHGGESEGWVGGYFLVPESGNGIVLLTNSRRSYQLMAKVVQAWANWHNLNSPRLARTYARLTAAVWILIIVFAAGAVWLVQRALMRIWYGTNPLAVGGQRQWFSRLLLTGGAVALLLFWWLFAHGILIIFLPVHTVWLAVALSVFCFLLLFIAVGPGRTVMASPR